MSKKFAVDLYFVILSPYSYIMFETLLSYRSKWPMTVALKPFALQHIFKAIGNTSPGLASPTKAAYSLRDVTRMARFHNIPLKIREGEAVARALYRRLWIDQADIFQNEDFLEKRNRGIIIEDKHSLVSSVTSKKVKTMIKRNTEDAINSGCYGAPWTVVTLEDGRREVFFGSDRLHIIGHLMGCQIDATLVSSL